MLSIFLLYQLTAKDIYNIFVKGRRPESKSEVYWQRKFPEHELDFSLWYQEMFCNKLCERKALDFNWKLFHGQVNAETKLKAMGFSDGFCKICKIEQENLCGFISVLEILSSVTIFVTVCIVQHTLVIVLF